MGKIKPIIITFIIALSINAYAENETMQEIVNEGIRNSEAAVKKFLVDSKNLTQERNAASKAEDNSKRYHKEASLAQDKYLKALEGRNGDSKHQGRGIQPIGIGAIFISFSMPEPSIKQIIEDAHRYNISVVARGLYKNSLRETADKIMKLTKEKNQGGILINPLWFKKYDIKAVPAVLLAKGSETNNIYDVVYGNVPLKRALTIIAEKGECAFEANNILARDKI